MGNHLTHRAEGDGVCDLTITRHFPDVMPPIRGAGMDLYFSRGDRGVYLYGSRSRAHLPDEGSSATHRSGRFSREKGDYTAPETRIRERFSRPGMATAKPILALVIYIEREARSAGGSNARACRQMKEPSEWIVPVAAD